MEENREIIVMLLDIPRTLARQDFRRDNEYDSNFVQIVNLTSRHNPTLKAWMNSKSKKKYKITYMSPRSQNKFIKLLAQECRLMIIEEINAVEVTSMVGGTTPDVNHTDHLTVAIWYVTKE